MGFRLRTAAIGLIALGVCTLVAGAYGQVLPGVDAPPLPSGEPASAPSSVTVAPGPGVPGTISGSSPSVIPFRPDAMFGKQKPLPPQAAAGMAVANRYHEQTQAGVRPTEGAEGAVVFSFGATEPNIVCAPLEVCDIGLQPGEQVSSVLVGDSARWQLEPAVSGVAPFERQHIVVKPADVGLQTSLIVTTDKRTYHMRLISRRTDYMPFVAFTYPDEVLAKWQALKAHTAAVNGALSKVIQESALETDPAGSPSGGPTSAYLSNLDFNYNIDGRAPWKPLRVFNDGVKTIIEMPPAMAQTEAPALLVVRRGGSVKNARDTTIVNYRVQSGRYIVDQIFDEAVLVAGVGGRQQRITITRTARPA